MNEIELIDGYMTWLLHNKGRSSRTIVTYRSYLVRLAEFLRRNDSDLVHADLESLDEFCGIEAHRNGLGAQTRRGIVSAVRGLYRWLKRSKKIAMNQALQLEFPTAARKLPRAMTLPHAEQILMAPDLDTFLGWRDVCVMAVLMGCGLRSSGVCALNESDLIWTKDENGHEVLVLRVREKGKKERLVPAPREVRAFVRAYLGHKELEAINRRLPDGDQVLFVTTVNNRVGPHEYYGEARRITQETVYRLIRKNGQCAGIPVDESHPHALRHLFGTQLAESDVHILRMQALLGHVKPETTEIYVQLAVEQLAKEVQRASPLAKIRSPVSGLMDVVEPDETRRSTDRRTHTDRSGSTGASRLRGKTPSKG